MEGDIKKQYLFLLTEIIAKEAVIFGLDVALYKAKNAGVVLDANNNAIALKGEGREIVKKLIAEFVNLSGTRAKDVLLPIFAKYPLINI